MILTLVRHGYIREKDVCTRQRRHSLSKKDWDELVVAPTKIEQANAGRRQGTIFHGSVLKWRAREYNYISETRSTNLNIPQTVLPLTQTFEKTRQNNETRKRTYVCLECFAAILMENYLRQTNRKCT